MPGSIDRLLDRLRVVRVNSDGWIYAHCPAHEDCVASLSIREMESGYVYIKCHAGCDRRDILDAVGLRLSDISGNHDDSWRSSRIAASYVYTDAEGHPLYRVLRLEPKSFRFERMSPGGMWVGGMDGVGRVIYRWHEIASSTRDTWVWFTEGEKDAETLRAAGFTSTCIAGGCKAKWERHFSEQIVGDRGREVVIVIPDSDAVGRDFALRVASNLIGKVHEVAVMDLFPDRDDGSDVSDFFTECGSDPASELQRMAIECLCAGAVIRWRMIA